MKYRKVNSKDLALKVGISLGLLSMASCSMSSNMFGNSDLQMSGNEHGYNAFFDGLSQAMINAKAKENIPADTPMIKLREQQEKHRTVRKLGYIPSLKPSSLKPSGGNNGK